MKQKGFFREMLSNKCGKVSTARANATVHSVGVLLIFICYAFAILFKEHQVSVVEVSLWTIYLSYVGSLFGMRNFQDKTKFNDINDGKTN
jgi:predicted membrane channel-forming protein YqfA (hemolysin III family)